MKNSKHKIVFIAKSSEYDDEAGAIVSMISAFTPKEEYIGDIDWAIKLHEKGIIPEVMPQKKGNKKVNGGAGCTCSIGFCEKENKWYGWSHRAMFGFGIGDKVKKGDCTNSSGWTEEYLKDHPEEDYSLPVGFEAKTIKDAKKMASAFADSVS